MTKIKFKIDQTIYEYFDWMTIGQIKRDISKHLGKKTEDFTLKYGDTELIEDVELGKITTFIEIIDLEDKRKVDKLLKEAKDHLHSLEEEKDLIIEVEKVRKTMHNLEEKKELIVKLEKSRKKVNDLERDLTLASSQKLIVELKKEKEFILELEEKLSKKYDDKVYVLHVIDNPMSVSEEIKYKYTKSSFDKESPDLQTYFSKLENKFNYGNSEVEFNNRFYLVPEHYWYKNYLVILWKKTICKSSVSNLGIVECISSPLVLNSGRENRLFKGRAQLRDAYGSEVQPFTIYKREIIQVKLRKSSKKRKSKRKSIKRKI